jgi:hypothetical protein
MYSTYAQFDRGSSINCISDKLETLRGYKVQNVRPVMIKGLARRKGSISTGMDIIGWQQHDHSKLGKVTVYSRFTMERKYQHRNGYHRMATG